MRLTKLRCGGLSQRVRTGLLLATIGASTATASANDLIWNAVTGNFTGSPAGWSYDDDGVLATTENPFSHIGAFPGPGGSAAIGGESIVYIGNDGDVTLNTTFTEPMFGDQNLLYGVRVGTGNPAADLSGLAGGADYQGDGMLTVTGNVPLLLFDPDEATTFGDLIVGGAVGITGAMNWNSTGVLNATGRIRVGQGGNGTLTQTDGTIINGQRNGGSKFMSVGAAGGTGVYNLDHGRLEMGDDFHNTIGGELRRLLRVGLDADSNGTLNWATASAPRVRQWWNRGTTFTSCNSAARPTSTWTEQLIR